MLVFKYRYCVLWGRMRRSQSTSFNLDDSHESEFRRGGLRATAGPRLGWSRDVPRSNNKYDANFFFSLNTDLTLYVKTLELLPPRKSVLFVFMWWNLLKITASVWPRWKHLWRFLNLAIQNILRFIVIINHWFTVPASICVSWCNEKLHTHTRTHTTKVNLIILAAVKVSPFLYLPKLKIFIHCFGWWQEFYSIFPHFSVFVILQSELDTQFACWGTEQVCEWLQEQGLGLYVSQAQQWIRSGQMLLNASQNNLEKVRAIEQLPFSKNMSSSGTVIKI